MLQYPQVTKPKGSLPPSLGLKFISKGWPLGHSYLPVYSTTPVPYPTLTFSSTSPSTLHSSRLIRNSVTGGKVVNNTGMTRNKLIATLPPSGILRGAENRSKGKSSTTLASQAWTPTLVLRSHRSDPNTLLSSLKWPLQPVNHLPQTGVTKTVR